MYKRSQLNIERSTGAVKTERLEIPSVRHGCGEEEDDYRSRRPGEPTRAALYFFLLLGVEAILKLFSNCPKDCFNMGRILKLGDGLQTLLNLTIIL